MAAVSALVSSAELPRVQAKLQRLEAAARPWPAPTPEARRRACLVVAAICPELPHESLALLVRHVLWSLRLDDRMDAPDADRAALSRLRDAVVAVPTSGRAEPDEPLAATLAAIRAELAGHDRTGALVTRYDAALRDAVTHDLDHVLLGRAVARGASPPTTEGYLMVAAHTVNYLGFAYALLAVGGMGLAARELDRLEPALRHAAYAVRLGNDLRSAPRDRAARALNVLDLRTAAGTPATPRWVRRQIDRHVDAHDRALARLTGLADPARALARCLRISLGFYRLTDLR